MKGIVAEGYETARCILSGRLGELHGTAAGLREYETLSGEALRRLLSGQPVDEPQEPASAAAAQNG